MPSGKSPKKNASQIAEDLIAISAAEIEAAVAELEQPKASRRRANPRERNRSTDRPRRRRIALPVLIVDETLLLPHMSIPYPVEDEESAMVLDRALRMTPRQVLVLTERVVRKPDAEDPNELEFRELVADTIGVGDEFAVEPIAEEADEDWVPDDALADEQFELCTV